MKGQGLLLPAEMRESRIQRDQLILITTVLILVALLPFAPNSTTKNALYSLLLAIEIICIVNANDRKEWRFPMRATLRVGLFFLAYLVLNLVGQGGGLERVVQAIVMMTTLAVTTSYKWSSSQLRVFRVVISLFLFAACLYWLSSGMPRNYFSFVYDHSNGFAVILSAAIVGLLIASNGRPSILERAMILLAFSLLAFSNSRSALASTLVMLVFLWIASRINRLHTYQRFIRIGFVSVLVFVGAFSLLYPALYETPLGNSLEQMSRAYLDKNFFSGRQVIWSQVLHIIGERSLFGWGLDATPSDFIDTQYSSHNLYLQTILQIGLVGLGLLLLLLWTLVRHYYRGISVRGSIGVATVLGVLVHECFEVSLTQNNFEYGLWYWVVFGITASLSNSDFSQSVGSADV